MISKKILTFSFLFLFCCFGAFSQKNYIKKANKLLNKFQYTKALTLFKASYEATEDPAALIGLVECLKGSGNLNLPENEDYLANLVEIPGVDPKYKFLFGQHLLSNDKYQAARSLFEEYSSIKPNDSRGASFLRKATKLVEERDENAFYEIYSLDMNTEFDDYSPVYYNDGILFSSDRGGVKADRIYNVTGRPYCDLYYTPATAAEPAIHETAELWGGNINTSWHEGTCDVTDDGTTVYFTRDNFQNKELRESSDDIVKLKIYTGKVLTDGSWTIFNELPFNSDEYSVMHPSLSPDENALYFSSDMPGGYGSSDIYVSYKVGSSWGAPQNLGPNVNSEGREVFPILSEDGITLYYASDGIAGYGGLDIFKTKLFSGTWEEAVNLGKPVNSGQDDFGFIIKNDTKTGYFTSRREGGQGLDDIYTFKKCLVLKGLVFDSDTDLPIPEANVIVEDANGNVIFEDYSNEDGIFKCCIEEETEYTVTTSHPDYPVDGELVFNSYETDGELVTVNIPMAIPPPPPPQACVVNGMVVDKESQRAIPGMRVIVQSKNKGPLEDVYTDTKGYFTFEAYEDDVYNVFTSSEFYYTGTAKLDNMNKKCNVIVPAARKELKIEVDPIILGEPVVLNHIYYDLDKYYIREDAKPEVEKLLTLLFENPGISIELSSHTDSRASDEYNLSLSQKRAEEVRNYLVARGIKSERVEPIGYGESRLINECANGVRCKNKRHQENRRTEFTVIDVNGNSYSNPLLITDSSIDGKNYMAEIGVYQSSGNFYTAGSTNKGTASTGTKSTGSVGSEKRSVPSTKKAPPKSTKRETSRKAPESSRQKKITSKRSYKESKEELEERKKKIQEIIDRRNKLKEERIRKEAEKEKDE